MKELRGEIILVRKVFDDVTCRYSWEIVVEMDDVPGLHCGTVELRQR